jgi:hypothetical protein
MNALQIARKDLQVFFKDRGSIIQSILVPLLLVFQGTAVMLRLIPTKRVLLMTTMNVVFLFAID